MLTEITILLKKAIMKLSFAYHETLTSGTFLSVGKYDQCDKGSSLLSRSYQLDAPKKMIILSVTSFCTGIHFIINHVPHTLPHGLAINAT